MVFGSFDFSALPLEIEPGSGKQASERGVGAGRTPAWVVNDVMVTAPTGGDGLFQVSARGIHVAHQHCIQGSGRKVGSELQQARLL